MIRRFQAVPKGIGPLAYGGMGKIALNKSAANPYNIDMKNTKAVFLIILGSFLLATGFAFAGTSSLYETSRGGVNFDGTTRNSGTVPVVAPQPAPSAVPGVAAPTKPEDTMMGKTKKFVKDNFSQIMGAVIIGFLAFLVVGTGGAALAAGAGAFGFFYMLKNL